MKALPFGEYDIAVGMSYVVLGVLSISFVLTFARLIRGPSLADRVIALDLVAYLAIGFLGTYSILIREETYIDVALLLGLLVFIGTLAFARYLERIHIQDQPTEL